jgi:protein SCO1
MNFRSIFAALILVASYLTPEIASGQLPSDSIYQLDIPLTTQDAKTVRLPVMSGHVRIVTMFYGSCSYVCPMTIETIKRIDSSLGVDEHTRLRMLLISIDPERDTPAALAHLMLERKLDASRWTLATAKSSDVRKIAAVLGVQYRQLTNKEFNHSTVLTLISSDGQIIARSNSIGSVDSKFVAAVRAALAKG